MQLKKSNPPYITHGDSTRSMMFNVILVLLMLYGMAIFFYGPRALVLGGVGAFSAVMTEWLINFLFRRIKPKIHDLSPWVTGLLIPLMLPATVPFRVPVVAAIFGISVAKLPFGGTGHNVFNPAAAGYAFAVTSFSSDIIFRYPQPLTMIPVWNTSGVSLYPGASFSMSIGGVPGTGIVYTALGNTPGPMGATHILVLLAGLVFLMSRRTIRWQIPVSFLATTTLIGFIFRRIPVTRLYSAAYENMTGLLLFGAIFMLGDPVTTPKRSWAKVAYAVVTAIIVMVFRHVGKVQESFTFALLLMNATVWGFDMGLEHIAKLVRRRKYESVADTKVS